MSKKPSKKKKPVKKPKATVEPVGEEPQRLQRAMAAAGFGSRRECEEFIEMGRVEVDGKIVTKLGTKVDPYNQKIFVDGQRLTLERRQYFVLNKPPGIVSTSKDPSGRLRVIDLIKTDQRVYNVGRLDQSSEGLILVTNDGDLANKLTHPRYGIAKKYLVQVQGLPTAEKLRSLVKGVYLAEGKARVSNIKFKKRAKDTAWLEIVLEEGRNREIRRLLARVGHKVIRLRRVAIGPLKLGEIPLGAHRALSAQEVRELKKAVSKTAPRKKKKTSKRGAASSATRRKTSSGPAKKKSKSTKRTKSGPRGKTGDKQGRGQARSTPVQKKRRTKKKSKRTKR